MNRIQWKDFFREIRKNKGRFFSLLFIVALGCAFYSGIRSSEPDMTASADRYYDETNFCDIRILSTLGLTEDDLRVISGIEGIEDCEGAYNLELFSECADDEPVMNVVSLGERINQFTIRKGRLPEKPSECFVDVRYMNNMGVKLGDTITLVNPDKEAPEELTQNTFTIVGYGTWAWYLNLTRGTASIGDGSVDAFLVLLPEVFTQDYYTTIFATVKGAKDVNSYDDVYDDIVEEVTDRLEDISDVQVASRRGALVAEGEEKLNDAKEKIADAKQELADALEKLTDGEKEYADGLSEYEDGRQKWEDGKASYEDGVKAYEDGKKAYEDGLIAFIDGKKKYEAGLKEYEDGAAQLAAGRETLDAARETLDEGLAEYEAGYAQYLAGKETLEEKEQELLAAQETLAETEEQLIAQKEELLTQKSQLEQLRPYVAAGFYPFEGGIEALDAALGQIEGGLGQIDDGLAQIEAGKEQLEAGEIELNAGKEALAASEQQLADAKAQLDAGLAEYEAGLEELEANEAKLADAKAVLDASGKEIAEAEKELGAAGQKVLDGEAALKDAKKQVDDGEKELLDAEKTLADARKELDDGWEEYNDGKAEADEKIADAEVEIADGEQKLADIPEGKWYVLNRDTIQTCVEYGMDAERIGKIAAVFPVIFFLVAALVCLTTMTRMIEEERMLIGTMKALGYGKASIISKYLFYAFSATMTGGLLGVLGGSKILPYVIMTAYGMLYTNVPYILMPYNLVYCAVSIGMALLCTVGAAWAACYKELMSTPAALMRPPAPKQGKKIFLERIPFLWSRMNFSFKSTSRNLFRYKKRLFMTILGIGGCMAVLLVSYGLHDSIKAIVDNQYKRIWTYSATCGMDENLDLSEKEALREELLTGEGMEAIENAMLARNISIDISTDTAEKTAYLYVPEKPAEATPFLNLHDRISGEKHELTDDGAILSEKLARMLGVSVGDEVELKISDTRYKKVPVTATAENYLFHYIYLTPKLYEEVFEEEPLYNEIAIRYAGKLSEEEEAALAANVLACENASSVSLVTNLQESVDNMLNALNLVVWVLVIAAGLLVFVVTFNLNNINISERRRELASLKVLGFYDMEVAMYVYRENIFLTLFGIIAGIFMGTWLHRYLITTLEVEMIMFGRNISLESYLYSSLLTVVFTILVNLVMFYKLRQIDMVESLKSVE